MQTKKLMRLFVIFCMLPFITEAQTYYNVTALSGQQVVNGRTVSVSTIGTPSTSSSCGVSPYWIQSGAYQYAFSASVFKIRIHFIAINYDDTVRMSINGNPYTITSSEIQNYSTSCISGPLEAFIYNGAIVGELPGLYGVQFDLTSSVGIDTFLIYQNTYSSGWVFDFAFADQCPGSVTATATHDTVCATGTLQLYSNATSSITSAVTYSWTGPDNYTSTATNPSISSVTTAATGMYEVIASDTGTCHYFSTLQVYVDTLLSAFTVSSNSPVCPGDTLKLTSPTFIGTNYSWSGPASFTSTAQNPTVIPFSLVDTGLYTLTATNSCNSVSYSTQVTTDKPGIPFITNTTPACTGHSLSLSALSSTSGATYYWTGPASFTSYNQNNVIPNITTANSGTYHVIATYLGCTTSDTVNVTVYPTPGIPVAGSNSPVCAGDTLKLTATDTSTGLNYTWSGPSTYSAFVQNPKILNANPNNSGTYTVVVSSNGCTNTASTSVTVIPVLPAPNVTVSAAPGDTICVGSSVSFSVFANNVLSPTYQWENNGVPIAGATGTTYSSSGLANGDVISCKVSSVAQCQPIDTGISNLVHISVITNTPPAVSVTDYANGNFVTFTGHIPSGYSRISYQWEKNGVKIPGATNIIYSTSALVQTDTFCLVVYDSLACTSPDSSRFCVPVPPLGIKNIAYGPDLQLFPNPNSGTFTVKGMIPGDSRDAAIEVLNTVGQIVFRTTVSIDNSNLDAAVNIGKAMAGVYFVKISWEQGSMMQRMVIY